MKSQDPKINKLHDVYLSKTGSKLDMRYDRERAWAEFIKEGYTEDDLVAVLDRLARLIQAGDRRPEAVKFSILIMEQDKFAQELDMISIEAFFNAKPKISKDQNKPRTVFEIKTLSEAARKAQVELEEEHANEDAYSDLVWSNEEARKKWCALED